MSKVLFDSAKKWTYDKLTNTQIWFTSEKEMQRWVRLGFGITGIGGVLFGAEQLRLMQMEHKEQSKMRDITNDLQTVHLIDSRRKQYFASRDEYPSFAKIHENLVREGQFHIPKTLNERRNLLEYVEWFGTLSIVKRNTLTPDMVNAYFGKQLNVILSNSFVMDQVLLQPDKYKGFLEISKRNYESQKESGKLGSVYFTTVREFFENFDSAVETCKPRAKELHAKRQDREQIGPAVIDGEYSVRCPYVEMRKKDSKQQDRQDSTNDDTIGL